jgi:hypothetical protein
LHDHYSFEAERATDAYRSVLFGMVHCFLGRSLISDRTEVSKDEIYNKFIINHKFVMVRYL